MTRFAALLTQSAHGDVLIEFEPRLSILDFRSNWTVREFYDAEGDGCWIFEPITADRLEVNYTEVDYLVGRHARIREPMQLFSGGMGYFAQPGR